MDRYLFVGGPIDGRRNYVPPGMETWEVDELAPMPEVVDADQAARDCATRTMYVKTPLYDGRSGKKVFVYYYGDQIMADLLGGYLKPPREKPDTIAMLYEVYHTALRVAAPTTLGDFKAYIGRVMRR